MAFGTIPAKGILITGTAVTTSVPSGSYTNIASVDLEQGVWLLTGGHEWSSSFTSVAITRFNTSSTLPGTVVRSTGEGGGGINGSTLLEVSGSVTVYMSVYQASGSTKTVKNATFTAYKLS